MTDIKFFFLHIKDFLFPISRIFYQLLFYYTTLIFIKIVLLTLLRLKNRSHDHLFNWFVNHLLTFINKCTVPQSQIFELILYFKSLCCSIKSQVHALLRGVWDISVYFFPFCLEKFLHSSSKRNESSSKVTWSSGCHCYL